MKSGSVIACAGGALAFVASAASGALMVDNDVALAGATVALDAMTDDDLEFAFDLSDHAYAGSANVTDGASRFANGSGHVTTDLITSDTSLSLFTGGSGSASFNNTPPTVETSAIGTSAVFVTFTLDNEYDVVVDYAISALFGGGGVFGGSYIGIIEGEVGPFARGGIFDDLFPPALISDSLESGGYSEDEWVLTLDAGTYTFVAIAVATTEEMTPRGVEPLNGFGNASYTANFALTLVPAPGAATLLAIGGLFAARRRR